MKMFELNDVEHGLLKNGVIHLYGEVDEDMVEYLMECLRILKGKGSPDISIEITSDGGNVSIGLSMIDMLSSAQPMATVILQSCNERLCAKHAGVMIHHINQEYISLDDLRDKKRLRSTRNEMEKDQKIIYDILCQRTKQKQSIIKHLCEKEEFMTAEQAKKLD